MEAGRGVLAGRAASPLRPGPSRKSYRRARASAGARALESAQAGHASREGFPLASLDFAAPKLGSGVRFKKLSGTLASRGARNPDALAAWIGHRKLDAARGRAGLSRGQSLASSDAGLYLAETTKDEQGKTL